MRFAPAVTTAVSAMTTANNLSARYLYYLIASAFYRYDTYTDNWQQLASPLIAPATLLEISYTSAAGYNGRAIGPGTGNNTIEMAGLSGNALVGYKIRIKSGTGQGQERTITAVSAPIVKDRGVVTTASNVLITDATAAPSIKLWKTNEFRDYQVRIDYGAGTSTTAGVPTTIRRILYNSSNSLNIYDINWASINTFWGGYYPNNTSATAGSQSLFQIESNIVTVDSNWDINPDSTSEFEVLSGAIWLISSAAGPGFSLQYYDVLADIWYVKSVQTGLMTAALGTDVTFERFTEAGGSLLDGTATSGASRSLTSSGLSLEVNRYANMELRITGGTGKGQVRTILANTSNIFYFTRDWDTNPDSSSTFSIFRDCGKLLMIGNGASSIFQYNSNSDMWTTGQQLDFGQVRDWSFKQTGLPAIAISSITRTSTLIKSLASAPTAAGSGYSVGQLLLIAQGSGAGATARITGVNSTGGVTSLQLEFCGTTAGYSVATGVATTVNPAGGTGCTVSITSVGEVATLTSAIAHTVKLGDSITVTGAVQSEYNGSQTVLGINIASNTVFQYGITGTPTTPATKTLTQSTTLLVDVNKTWITNEHVGRLVEITAPGQGNSQVRRITANTSNTLSFATATLPVNGTFRYVIFKPKAYGTEISVGSKIGNGNSGIATGGSSTTLVDSSKNWPVNYWSNIASGGTGRKVRILSGTGVGNEIVITSNTANTLTFATQSFSVDTTSVYEIMENAGIVSSGSATTLVDLSQNWPINSLAGKRVKLTGGTGQGNEYAITSNTQTTLTFPSATAPDSTTTYSILAMPARSVGIHIDAVYGCSDPLLNNRYLYFWRGGGTTELSRYNIITEEVEFFTYFPLTETLSTGSMYAYDGKDRIYFHKDQTGRIMYYDIVKNIVVPFGFIPYGMSTVVVGNRMEVVQTEDGLKYLYIMRHSGTEMWRTLIFV
jgi:hypothetical protein